MKMILYKTGQEPRIVDRPFTTSRLQTLIGGAPVMVNADCESRFAIVKDGQALRTGRRLNRTLTDDEGKRVDDIYGDFAIVRWKSPAGGIKSVFDGDLELVKAVIV